MAERTRPPRVRSSGASAPPPSLAAALRPAFTIFVMLVVLSGIAYPDVVTEVAQILAPATANGSLLPAANGTWVGSSLLGQNITNLSLFWLRPSMIDYLPFEGAGGEVPYGPTDPHLLNITAYYIALYGLENVSVPLGLVSPSASGLDPDLTPAAALVQVPRVAFHAGVSEEWLTAFVTAHIDQAGGGLLGPEYVNVVPLDIDLLMYLSHRAGGTT